MIGRLLFFVFAAAAIPLFALSNATAAARRPVLREQVVKEIESMRAIRSSIDRTSDKRKKADAWLDLNQAADRLHQIVWRKKELEPLFRKIATLGISVVYCEADGMW
ncbi:MAG: hypothetical protein ACRD3J_09730, partial [Thermoanaerobaculia bacterium]